MKQTEKKIEDRWAGVESWSDVFNIIDSDLDRFPLPICFEPYEEQRQFYWRTMFLIRLAKRFFFRYFLKQPSNEANQS